jgi:hypothetical protein
MKSFFPSRRKHSANPNEILPSEADGVAVELLIVGWLLC